MSYQPTNTPFADLVWHYDPLPRSQGGDRYRAFLGEAQLTAYVRGEWQVHLLERLVPDVPSLRALGSESGIAEAKRRAFLVHGALTCDPGEW